MIPHAVLDSSIGSITWSDHAPVILSYALMDALSSKTRMWKLNKSLLQDKEVLMEVIEGMGFYFQTNATPESDPCSFWEAHKAVIRRVLIKHGS